MREPMANCRKRDIECKQVLLFGIENNTKVGLNCRGFFFLEFVCF